jgi:ribonucleoside-diphosphate reductase alpha chain
MLQKKGELSVFMIQKKKRTIRFIQRLKEEDENYILKCLEYGRRNIALLTIAPTGTTSLNDTNQLWY